MIKLNGKNISRAFVGDTKITKIYRGEQLIFENALMYTTEVSKLTVVTSNVYQAAIDHEFELKANRTYYIKINGSVVEGQLMSGTYQGSEQNVLCFQVANADFIYIYNKAAYESGQIIAREDSALLTCYLTNMNPNNIGVIEIFFKDE